MKAVKFLMAYTVGTLYAEGEIAGFHDPVADELIERGIAEEAPAKKGGKKKDDADPAKELDAKTVAELDKIIAAEGIADVPADANKTAKIAAIIAARAA